MALTYEEKVAKAGESILKKLQGLDTYEERHKYLSESTIQTKSGKRIPVSKIVDKFPEVSTNVNHFMIGNVIAEMGNPEDSYYTFSKEVSDDTLLKSLASMESTTAEMANYDAEKLRSEYKGKQAEKDDLLTRKTNLQKSILQHRKEFDDRVGWFSGPGLGGEATKRAGVVGSIADLFMGMVVPAATLAHQIVGFIPDQFREAGMEQFEARSFKWDPETEKYGPPSIIGRQQDELATVLNSIKNFEEMSQEHKDFQKLDTEYNESLKIYTDSILDDLIDDGYATKEDLRKKMGYK